MHICIHGGGILGVCLASELVTSIKFDRKKNKITIIEPNKTLLSSWDCVRLNNTEVNNGYHTIEFPRGRNIKKTLERLNCMSKMKEEVQQRSIIIDNTYIKEPLDLKNWPRLLAEEQNIIWRKWKKRNYKISDMNSFLEILEGTEMYNRTKICRDRYYGSADDSIWQFFPWFFAGIFTHQSGDEGDIFRHKMRSGEVQATNLVPKNGLFQDLKKDITSSLIKRNIEIKKDSSQLTNVDLNIWTSSLANYMKKLDMGTEQVMRNPKKLRLIVVKLKKNREEYPSEILVLNTEFPEVARIYFKIDKDNDSHYTIIEAIEGEKLINEEDVVKFVCSTLEVKMESYESKITRYMWFTPDANLKPKSNEIIELARMNGMIVPLPYWRPINMCKQANAAKDFVNDILKF